MHDKERARADFMDMTKSAWTFHRLNEDEQADVMDLLKFAKLSGNYKARYETLQALYFAFLRGAGYNGSNWRE